MASPEPETTIPPDQPGGPSSFGRKIRWMAAFVVALVLLVSAGWFVGAHFYQRAIDEARTALEAEGVRYECVEQSLGGFPARFELRCASLAFSFANGATLSGGPFSTVSPIWNPLFVIAEWQGPFNSVSAGGLDAQIGAPLARASIRMSTALTLQRLSAVLDPFTVTLQGAPQPIAQANQAEVHIRQPVAEDTGENDLEVAALALGVSSPFLGGVDTIDLSLTGVLEELASVRARSAQDGLRLWIAQSGIINALAGRLRLDDHAINLDGNGAIASDGLVDFTGTIATNDVAALVDLMGIDASNGAAAITAGATFFGRQTTIDEDDAIELPLTVNRGTVSIGPVPLGDLPAITP